MTHPIRVVALDLDDTLLRVDGSISARTLTLLQAWRAAGNQVVIATGRPPRAVATALPDVLSDAPWICYNGAEVLESGRSIFRDMIPTADARSILSRAQADFPAWPMGVEIDDRLYLNRPSPRRSRYAVAEDLLAVTSRPAAKLLFFSDPPQPIGSVHPAPPDELDGSGQFAQLAPLLADLPPSTRAMHSVRYRLMQLMSRTADKAEALRFTVERWGLDMANVIAFGDDVNDVDMLRRSGCGVAVANAVPEVHAVADRVTASNDEDGVAAVLEMLLAD